MKRVKKGKSGYIRYEKTKRLLVMLLMFAIPLAIFFSGYYYTGTRKNLLTVVAIVGIIPAARFAVSYIMIMLQKPAPKEIIRETENRAGSLVRAYELTVTAYEGSMPLDALVIYGNSAACISVNGKKDKFSFMEKHIEGILAGNGYKSVKVKIFAEPKAFFDRVTQLAAKESAKAEQIAFVPDERYPELSREELILHTIMAISL